MKKDARLDARQIRILEDYFKRSMDGENMETIAKENGINRKTLSLWKNTHHGIQLYDQYINNKLKDAKPLFFQKLKEGMAKNSYKHLELYAKIEGMLAPEKKEIVSKIEQHNIIKDGLNREMLNDLESLLGDTPTIKRVK
ncbi:hypothetical protein HMPREF3291_22465 [Bacillus sp. HMSC76G11]|nr:hypothetical protein HMPREF3291_22465 [Bacillus sp. HMSC76G11]